MNRPIALTLIAVTCLILALLGYYGWDSSQNRGHTYGYYGEYNTVSNAFARIPNLTILESWYHRDLRLEEFGFRIRSPNGQTNKIWFSEKSPMRMMSGEQLEHALRATLQEISDLKAGEMYL